VITGIIAGTGELRPENLNPQQFEADGSMLDLCAGAEQSRSRYLTCEEAAEYLGGLNSRTVARWARERYLPAIPLGEGKKRLWRFTTDDLDAWMEARRQVGALAA
jgi:excisionase family DNA binding protein